MREAKATDRLFDLLPPLDVGDPEAFISATGAILAQYPDEVVEMAIDPVLGIPSRTDRPTLKMIKAVCEEFYAPLLRAAEREESKKRAARALPRPPRTAEEQARIDAQVAEARRKLRIPEGGGRRAVVLPPSADAPFHSGLPGKLDGDGKHAQRVAAELERRRSIQQAREDIANERSGEEDHHAD